MMPERRQLASAARAKRASERTRHPTEVRRPLIVEAARSVIADRGLFATTMRDIAAASGVSLGTVTYHFRGIAEILGEVLDLEMDALYAPAPGSTGCSGWTSGRWPRMTANTQAGRPPSTSAGSRTWRRSSGAA